MMKERLAMAGITASVIFASCAKQDPALRESRISFNFAEPVRTTQTRSGSPFDTNSFILTVRSVAGDIVYCGAYGGKPEQLSVKAGSYEVSVTSDISDLPAFNNPVYGDSQIVIASNGEDVNVEFLCKMTNAGISLSLTDAFRTKYPAGKIVLRQDDGQLEYGYGETRTGWFKPGNVTFWYCGNGPDKALFNRTIAAGERHSLTLNASREDSQSGFSITVDTTVLNIAEIVTVGDDYAGEDGSSTAKALSINTVRKHPGDTVWVWGYIIGGDLSSTSANFDGPFTKASNLALASNAAERTYSNASASSCPKPQSKALSIWWTIPATLAGRSSSKVWCPHISASPA